MRYLKTKTLRTTSKHRSAELSLSFRTVCGMTVPVMPLGMVPYGIAFFQLAKKNTERPVVKLFFKLWPNLECFVCLAVVWSAAGIQLLHSTCWLDLLPEQQLLQWVQPAGLWVILWTTTTSKQWGFLLMLVLTIWPEIKLLLLSKKFSTKKSEI